MAHVWYPPAWPAHRMPARLQLHDVVVTHAVVSDLGKARIAERLAQADKALIDGADEELQLLDVAAFCMQAWRAAA